MNRRNFLALLSTPVLVALVNACSDDSPGREGAESGEARSSVPRRTTTAADAAPAADAVNAFGMDLYRMLAGVTTGNLVVSPVSIATALTMVVGGAAGTTLDELVATLKITDPATVHHAMNALDAELAHRTAGDVTLSVSNSLWAQQGLSIESAFLDLLAREYGAGLELVDYREDPDGARREINEWVAEETADHIPELLGEDAITRDTRLALVNAVYLKAPWQEQFDPERTEPHMFATTSDELVEVPMMFMAETLPYAAGDGWQAVELAYEGGELSMLVFLPEEGFLADFEQIFLVTDALPYVEPTLVHLSMPRFEIESALSLAGVLDAIGMKAAFTSDADFSGITGDEPLRISDVIHQANISVDEGGTEAAAATAVLVEATGAPIDVPEPVVVRCDQPFVFVLRDRTTGTILFLGRVGEPLGAAG